MTPGSAAGLLAGLFALATSVTPNALPASHPDHASIAEAEFDLDAGVIQVALRVDGRHLEDAVRAADPDRQRLDLEDRDDVGPRVIAYLSERFQVRPVGGQPLAVRWSGHEVQGADAWLYFEWRLPEPMTSWNSVPLEVRSTVMLESVRRQVNTVTFAVGSSRSSVTFRAAASGWQPIDLPALGRALAERRDAAWLDDHQVVYDREMTPDVKGVASARVIVVPCLEDSTTIGTTRDAVRVLLDSGDINVLAVECGPLAALTLQDEHAASVGTGGPALVAAHALADRLSSEPGSSSPRRATGSVVLGIGIDADCATASRGLLVFADAVGRDIMSDDLRRRLTIGDERRAIVVAGARLAEHRARCERVHGALLTATVLRGAAALDDDGHGLARPGPVTIAWIARDLRPEARLLALVKSGSS